MSLMRVALNRVARRLLVSTGNTRIRAGILRGRLLPHSIAAVNLAMVLGRYESDIQRMLAEQSHECQVAYDIGAHVGFFTLLLAQVMGEKSRVFAFEPSADEADRVEELARCNGLEDRVSVERFAVCDEVAELTFYTGHASFTGILDKVSKPRNRESQASVTVQGITLDEFVYGRNNPAPDLIKVDVEAAEASVMRGAAGVLDEKRPIMLIEVHGPNPCRDTIAEILSHQYKISYRSPNGLVAVTEPDQLRDQFWNGNWTNHLLAVPV